MAVSKRLRTAIAEGGTPEALVQGISGVLRMGPTRANMGTADVRKDSLATTVLTITGWGAGDEFKLGVYAFGDDGDFARTDTIGFTSGTDGTSAAIQTALRTATSDDALTVTGTTDSGPFTVTHFEQVPEIVAHTCTAGTAVQVTRGAISYGDPAVASTTVPTGIVFDQESSRGINMDVPLGHSIVSDGTGQSAQTVLVVPTIDGAAGGTAEVVITGTEVASGGTNAVVLYGIRPLAGGDWVHYAADADGDLTVSSLAVGDYVLVGHTQTANGRVSAPSFPTYFSVV